MTEKAKEGHHHEALSKPWVIEDMTDEQREKIKQFKSEVSEVISSEDNDLQLVRWLVARKWDVNEASKMYKESKKMEKRTENRYHLRVDPRHKGI